MRDLWAAVLFWVAAAILFELLLWAPEFIVRGG
jgi:hypothetical protein